MVSTVSQWISNSIITNTSEPKKLRIETCDILQLLRWSTTHIGRLMVMMMVLMLVLVLLMPLQHKRTIHIYSLHKTKLWIMTFSMPNQKEKVLKETAKSK